MHKFQIQYLILRALTSNIALEMGYATGLHYNALFATGDSAVYDDNDPSYNSQLLHYKKKVVIGGGYL